MVLTGIWNIFMLNKINKFIGMSLAEKIRYCQFLYDRIYFCCFTKIFLRACGSKAIIRKPLFITPEYIALGSNVYIAAGCRIEGIASYLSGDKYNPLVVIEDGVSFEQFIHITAASKLVIDKGTIASYGVMITDIDHGYQKIGTPIGQQPIAVNETYIGKNCFIGAGAKINAGTMLGKQCIVGANAVVRGVFPDYCVIVGAPAKIIKRYNPVSGLWQKTNSDGEFISDLS